LQVIRLWGARGRFAALAALGLAAVVVDTWVLRGSPQGVGYDLIGAASVTVMFIAVRRQPSATRRGWLVLAAGFALWTLGDGAWSFYSVFLHREAPWPGLPDVLYLAGYPAVAVGLLLLTRGRAARPHSFGDAAIVSLGCGVLLWQLVVDPSLDAPGNPTLGKVVIAAYPMMDLRGQPPRQGGHLALVGHLPDPCR
jgi:hypothetical protein